MRQLPDDGRAAPGESTVSKALVEKLDYTTKRLSARAPTRDAGRCAAWHANVSRLYTRRQFVTIDEAPRR